MTRVKISQEDFETHLKEQVQFLISSSYLFDQGNLSEAKRLATTVRVLLYDSGRSLSILKSIGEKDNIKFLNTGNFPKNTVIYTGLVYSVVLQEQGPYVQPKLVNTWIPLLEGGPSNNNFSHFDRWWKHKILIENEESFAREEVIRLMANQDGGAHVDTGLDEKYKRLASGLFSSLRSVDGFKNAFPFENLHYSLVRQIAHETIITLNNYFKLNLKYTPSNEINTKGSLSSFILTDFTLVKGDNTMYEEH